MIKDKFELSYIHEHDTIIVTFKGKSTGNGEDGQKTGVDQDRLLSSGPHPAATTEVEVEEELLVLQLRGGERQR